MLLNFVELGTTFLAGQEITFLFPKFCVHSKELNYYIVWRNL